MPDTERGGEARISAGLFAATIASMASFHGLFRGAQWWVLAVVIVGTVLTVAVLLRSIGARAVWQALGIVAAWFLSLMWLFASSTALLWVIPTPSTFGQFGALTAEAFTRFTENEAPLTVETPDLFFMTAVAGLIAILVDLLAIEQRAPALTGLVFAAVYVSPAVVAGIGPSAIVFVAIALPWLYVMRADIMRQSEAASGRQRARRQFGFGPVVIAAAAVVVGVLVPPALPASSGIALNWGQAPPSAFDTGINPILALGQNLRRGASVTALEYTTESTRPVYLKVTNLNNFTGQTWRPGPSEVSRESIRGLETAGIVGDDIETIEVETNIAIRALNAKYLPMPYPTQSVEGLRGNWQWEPEGRNFRTTSSGTRGQGYTVLTQQREPTLEQMRAADATIVGALTNYTQLPAGMPRNIRATAAEVTATAANDYDRAIALQSYFRDGEFTYSEEAPVEEGYDGNGVDVVSEFLEVKRGYCVHYSSAMAIMARSLGIPARIAVGYAPGDRSGRVEAGRQVMEVSSDRLHAWPELYFADIGWVKFEPTPGRGVETQFRSAFDDDASDELNQGGAANTPEALAGDQSAEGATGAEGADEQAVRNPAFLVVAMGLVVLAIPCLVRTIGRRRRLTQARSSRAPVDLVWTELVDSARDYGVDVSRADTPRSFARRLTRRPGVDEAVLHRLLGSVEQERYGRPLQAGGAPAGVGQVLDDLATMRQGLRARSSRLERLRATLLPRSLFGQVTYARVPDDLREPGQTHWTPA